MNGFRTTFLTLPPQESYNTESQYTGIILEMHFTIYSIKELIPINHSLKRQTHLFLKSKGELT